MSEIMLAMQVKHHIILLGSQTRCSENLPIQTKINCQFTVVPTSDVGKKRKTPENLRTLPKLRSLLGKVPWVPVL